MASKVVIVGAGFGGIAAAIEFKRHGITDITILDSAPELGGTWFHNTYPGSACDVPSQFYSFSYAQRRDWPRLCSPQEEILSYVKGVAREHGIDRFFKGSTTVTACNWDDGAHRWSVHTEQGETYEADAIVLATGQLHQPAYPPIEGAGRFEGHSFHSARWDHSYDMRAKRVAVIGTGASAVQFVPELAPEVERMTVFQRTGNWFMPRKNRPYPNAYKTLVERVPGFQTARRKYWFHYCELLTQAIRRPAVLGRLVGLRAWLFMRWQLRDPELRRKVWPDYTFGCKRVLFSSHFLPALARKNVDLVTERIAEIRSEGVLTADGVLHEADCLIYGTGFQANDFMFPMEVTGAGGRNLREEWASGAHAYLGMAVPGFPSMFVMYGPNTNTSGGSIIFYLERQARYIRQALQQVEARGADAIDVRREVEAASDREVQASFAGTAWTRCDSWYRDGSGRIVANWPGSMRDYEERTRELDPGEYEFIGG